MCRDCDRAARDEGWTGLTASCGCLAEAVIHGYHRTDGTCTRKVVAKKESLTERGIREYEESKSVADLREQLELLQIKHFPVAIDEDGDESMCAEDMDDWPCQISQFCDAVEIHLDSHDDA